MQQEKSESLRKHLTYIKGTVDYLEISGHLLSSKTISASDHHQFLGKLWTTGNSDAMQDLVNTLEIRRDGFAALVTALRVNEYTWLANEMDPRDGVFQVSQCPNVLVQDNHGRGGVFSSILRRRQSEKARISAETVFTSYRQSFPMDLSSSTRSLNHFSQSPSLSKSFDTLSLFSEDSPKKLPSSVKSISKGKRMAKRDLEVITKSKKPRSVRLGKAQSLDETNLNEQKQMAASTSTIYVDRNVTKDKSKPSRKMWFQRILSRK